MMLWVCSLCGAKWLSKSTQLRADDKALTFVVWCPTHRTNHDLWSRCHKFMASETFTPNSNLSRFINKIQLEDNTLSAEKKSMSLLEHMNVLVG